MNHSTLTEFKDIQLNVQAHNNITDQHNDRQHTELPDSTVGTAKIVRIIAHNGYFELEKRYGYFD